jgi:O-antigen/teichoic acid export membrane protein
MVGVAVTFLQQVFGFMLVAQNRQLQALYVLIGVLVANLVLNVILIPLYGTVGAAVALVISELASLLATAAIYARVGKVPRPYLPLRTGTAAAAMVAIVVAARYALTPLVPSSFVTLLVGGAVGSLAYVLALRQLRAVPPAMNTLAVRLLRRGS